MGTDEWPPTEEFPDRLAKLRRVLGLSNQAIAVAADVNTETVSKWAGGQEPKGDKLLALARLFGVTVAYLLEGKIEPGLCKRPVALEPIEEATLSVRAPRRKKARRKKRRVQGQRPR